MKQFGTGNEPFIAASGFDIAEGQAEELGRPTNQEANNNYSTLKNAIESTGQSLTQFVNSDPQQLAKALFIAGSKAMLMDDTGTDNLKQLTSKLTIPDDPSLLDGCIFYFKNKVQNSAAVFINVYNSLSIAVINNAELKNGSQSITGAYISTDQFIYCIYRQALNTFELINNQRGGYSGIFHASTAATLDATAAGCLIIADGTSLTLPPASYAPRGSVITVKAKGGNLTIYTAVGDAIDAQVSVVLTSFIVNVNCSASFVSNGVANGTWELQHVDIFEKIGASWSINGVLTGGAATASLSFSTNVDGIMLVTAQKKVMQAQPNNWSDDLYLDGANIAGYNYTFLSNGATTIHPIAAGSHLLEFKTNADTEYTTWLCMTVFPLSY